MTDGGLKQKVTRLRQAYAPHEHRPLGGYLVAMGTYATVTASLVGLATAARVVLRRAVARLADLASSKA